MSVITYQQIKEEAGYLIGSPKSDWDAVTTSAVESAIRSGVDRVIHNGQHQFSWMRPKWTLETAVGQRRYTLPQDFEQFVSDLYYDGTSYQYPPITQLPATRLMQLVAETTTTGTPTRYAIETETNDGVTQQGSILVLDPTPDAAYPLFGMYVVSDRPLSDANPHPPGGPAHGELFLASVLAKIESRIVESDKQPVKEMEFREMLMNHIAIDLRRQPRNLGRMGGRPARMTPRADLRQVMDLEQGPMTYNSSTDL